MSTGLPGGVGVSRLRVYDWAAGDGLAGGSPHLHTASTEGYVVLGGSGAVETIDADGFRSTPLEAGRVLWFTPGTVHRLVNADGRLEILTLMSNAGLPEAGDAVLTFPSDVLADPDEYRRRAALPATDDPTELEAAARARRDLALKGYAALRADPSGRLAALHGAAAAIVRSRVADWRRIVESGPAAQVAATTQQLDALADGLPGLMAESAVARRDPAPGDERWGMCGRLTVWPA